MSEPPDCVEVRELLPEIAAGVATSDERARALRHLATCAECRRELDALATVVDELLTLVPPMEPPAGLERAVLAKVAPPRRRWWQHRALRLATVGALAVAVGAVVTLRATAHDRWVANQYQDVLRVAGGRYLTVRVMTAPHGSDAGRVFAYEGTPSWVFVVVRYDGAVGPHQVTLVTRDGRDRPLGEMQVSGGRGSWGVAIETPVSQIAEVRVVGVAGPPLTAVFR